MIEAPAGHDFKASFMAGWFEWQTLRHGIRVREAGTKGVVENEQSAATIALPS